MVGILWLVRDFHFAEFRGLVQAAVNRTGRGLPLTRHPDRRPADEDCLTFFL